MKLTIIYWNTAARDGLAAIALQDRREADVIAVQEPYLNRQTKTIYCPSQAKYRRIYGGGRAAIYIHKRHPLYNWKAEANLDWCWVVIHGVTIWSIYSPIPASQPVWNSPLQRLASEEPTGPQLIIGDLNLHHPLWDRAGRTTPESSVLLTLARRWRLKLITPWGEPTRKRHNERDSTIDHAWVTASLPCRYYGDLGYEGSDHRAQLIEITTLSQEPRRRAAEALGWSWTSMDRDIVATEAKGLYLLRPLDSPAQIDDAVDHLTAQLTRIADASTPRRKVSQGRGEPWWTGKVHEAIHQARAARRRYAGSPTEPHWRALQDACDNQAHTIKEAKRKSWRNALDEASRDTRQLWNLERWARLRSHQPPEPLFLPPLRPSNDEPPTATSHAAKASILAQRFFPPSIADLSDVHLNFQDDSYQRFPVDQEVKDSEIKTILCTTGAWKAPGTDLLPTGFLKACKAPLAKLLAELATACLQREHFPTQFRTANVVVLRKPGKTIAQQQTAGAYRPISLLNAMGKVIEKVMSTRIAAAAELQGLLPETQMGNRPERSTDLAIKLVVDATHTAWRHGAVASLLQLDIKGAFDTVNHTRLLHTLQLQGFPPWVVRWVRSFLESRTASLNFDGESTPPYHITAGVPQGSPLSPILFLLYTASLYTQLQDHTGLIAVGFADDLNLLAFGKDTQVTRRHLESAWQTIGQWACTRGMEFEPEKSELIHLTRARAAPTTPVLLDQRVITPLQEARFLGVWIDRKLKWKGHLKAIKRKFATQQFALTRLAASAWGCSLLRAREIYTKVIRSAVAYGAGIWHHPTDRRITGIAGKLATTQSQCLRVVSGAYRATPVRFLEVETATPPLDLYLNKWVVDFEHRLEYTGKGDLIRAICNRVATRLQQRRQRHRNRRGAAGTPAHRPSLEYGEGRTNWAKSWLGNSPSEKVLWIHWQRRWQQHAHEPPDRRRVPAPAAWPIFSYDALKKHKNLLKHESSLLTQIRTGKVGLRAFLFERKIPEVATPRCPCGEAPETAAHLALDCRDLTQQREELQRQMAPKAMRTYRDFVSATAQRRTALKLVRWFLSTGRFPEFRLAEQYRAEAALRDLGV
jgi:retron-type reverse transcriptase